MSLSRPALLFFLLLAASASAALAWFPSLAGAVLSVLSGIFLLGAGSARTRLKISCEPPGSAAAGCPAAGLLRVENPSRLFPVLLRAYGIAYREPRSRVAVRLRWTGTWAIGPGETALLRFRIRPRRRGLLRIERAAASAAGLPPFFHRRAEAQVGRAVLVHPRPARVVRPVRLPPLGLFQPAAPPRLPRGPDEEWEGLRDYLPGDSLRDVHWRTSFKRPGGLRVRRRLGSGSGRVFLHLDLSRDAEGRRGFRRDFERAISAAAALFDHLDRQGLEVALCVADRRFFGRRDLPALLEALALLEPSGEPAKSPEGDPGDSPFAAPRTREPAVWITARRDFEAPEGTLVLGPARMRSHFEIV